MLNKKETKKLSDGLSVLRQVQEKTSELVPGAHVEDEVTNEMISLTLLCLVDELGELAKELGYKPWKPIKVDNERVIDEFADVLAFLGVLLYYIQEKTGITMSQLSEGYYNKTFENINRFIGFRDSEGYSGVSKNYELAVDLLERMVKED